MFMLFLNFLCFKIMLLDEFTTKLLSSCCKMTDLLEEGVTGKCCCFSCGISVLPKASSDVLIFMNKMICYVVHIQFVFTIIIYNSMFLTQIFYF